MPPINVPNVPGVPPLSSYTNDAVGFVEADAFDLLAAATGISPWGVYLQFSVGGLPIPISVPIIPAIYYDSQLNFSYSQDWKISTYPVEQGSFQSYDKVQQPAEIRCRFSAGASVLNRQAMLASIDLQMSTTALYSIVTPEKVYLNYNFTHRDYDREAAKVGLVVIDVYFVEVMQTATAQFQATQSPVNAGQVGLGTVAANPTAPATQAAVSSNFMPFDGTGLFAPGGGGA